MREKYPLKKWDPAGIRTRDLEKIWDPVRIRTQDLPDARRMLSGKSIRLASGRSQVRIPAGSRVFSVNISLSHISSFVTYLPVHACSRSIPV